MLTEFLWGQLTADISQLQQTVTALQRDSGSKDTMISLEKALDDGISALRFALNGKVEKAQLEYAINQMQQMKDDTSKIDALKRGLSLVAKELTRKADIESLKMVEAVMGNLDSAKPQAAFGRRMVSG